MIDNIYSPEYVKKLFNRMSGSYERMNYITSFGFSIRWRKQFLHHFQPTADKVELIDLLTGMGETWVATKRRLPGAKITALDFSEGMLNHAREKNEQRFGNEVFVLQQDVLQNNLPANHYDFVTCAFGLKTFDHEQLVMLAKEVERILKPGGHISFIEVSKPGNKVLSSLYGLYLGLLIPVIGWLFLGNPREYKMLWKYTLRFRNARAAAEVFAASDLDVTYQSYFFGCATGFSGRKKNGIKTEAI